MMLLANRTNVLRGRAPEGDGWVFSISRSKTQARKINTSGRR